MSATLDGTLRTFVESETGGTLTSAGPLSTGGSREMYLVEVSRPDGTALPLVLRCEAGGSFTGTEISPAREATVYRALADTPVPVPRMVALAPDGAALLMERLPGTSDLTEVTDTARHAVMVSFVDALAALHNLDVDALDLPGFGRPRRPGDHARLDLEMWTGLCARHVTDPDPLLLYAGAWLHSHAPTEVPRTVVVQGDTGPGNFVFEGDHVTGIVDWEFAHLGDPMDDWAWLDMRNGGPLPAELVERYTGATGIPFDQGRVDYYRGAVDYRCAITTSLAVSRGGGARGWAPYLMVTQRYLGDLARRLGALAGVTAQATLPELPTTPRTPMYDALLEGVRTAVGNLDDVEVREATRNLQILVRHLRAHDQIGAEVYALDHADRAATFGSEAELSAAALEQAGAEGDERVLGYLLRRNARERLLWASLLDRRAR